MDKHIEVLKTIRQARGNLNLTQEDMAEKLDMSPAGYAKIERGETKLNLEKLEQIVNILDIDIIELLQAEKDGNYFLVGENHGHNSVNYYGNNETLANEIEKLNVIIEGQKELLFQKDNEIAALNKIITLLENKS